MANRKVTSTLFLLLFLFNLLLNEPVSAQNADEPLASELLSRIQSEPLSLTALIQATGSYSFRDNGFIGGRAFGVDNMRVAAGGVLDGNFEYRIQFNFSREPNLLDAYLGYRLSDRFNLRAGAQKPQISREHILSPDQVDFIDRARLRGAQLNSRDIGISAFGNLNPELGYNVGIYNGTGLHASPDNRFFFTGRMVYDREVADEQAFFAGVSFAFGECLSAACSPANVRVSGSRFTYGADVRYETGRWILAGELLATNVEVIQHPFDEERILGGFLTAGYKPAERTTLLVRWDHLSFRKAESGDDLLLAGLNQRLTGLIEFQLNLLVLVDGDRENQMGAKANLQLRF